MHKTASRKPSGQAQTHPDFSPGQKSSFPANTPQEIEYLADNTYWTMKFNEYSTVKIPAILHLCRLGYKYISLNNAVWDTETNIFTEII